MHTIEISNKQTQEYISSKIGEFNDPIFKINHYHVLSFHIKNEQGQIIAGINGDVLYQAAEASFLWVHEDYRSQALGSKLLVHFEKQAQLQGATYILLDTFDFQAPTFYEQLGYDLLAKTPKVYNGMAKNFYSKSLVQEDA